MGNERIVPEKMFPELRPFAEEMCTYVTRLVTERSFPRVDVASDHALLTNRLYQWLRKKGLNLKDLDIDTLLDDAALEIARTLEWALQQPDRYTSWKERGSINDLIAAHAAFIKNYPVDPTESRVGVICETNDVRLCQMYHPASIKREGNDMGLCLHWNAWFPMYEKFTRIDRGAHGEIVRPPFELYSVRAAHELTQNHREVAAGRTLMTIELYTPRQVVIQAELRSSIGPHKRRLRHFPLPDTVAFNALFELRNTLEQGQDSIWPIRFDRLPCLHPILKTDQAVTRSGIIVQFNPAHLREYVCAKRVSVTADMNIDDVHFAAEIAGTLDMTAATNEQRASLTFISHSFVDLSENGGEHYVSLKYLGWGMTLSSHEVIFPSLERAILIDASKAERIAMPRIYYQPDRFYFTNVPDTCRISMKHTEGTMAQIIGSTLGS